MRTIKPISVVNKNVALQLNHPVKKPPIKGAIIGPTAIAIATYDIALAAAKPSEVSLIIALLITRVEHAPVACATLQRSSV